MSMSFDERIDALEQSLVELTNLAQEIPTLDEEDAVIHDDIFAKLDSMRERIAILEEMVAQTRNSLVNIARDRGIKV